MVRVNTTKKELLDTLKLVKRAIRGRSAQALATTGEITVIAGEISITVPGAIFSLRCKTEGTCKATLRFLHFMQIIKDLRSDQVELIIKKDSMQIDTLSFPVQTTFFENDSILRSIDLPINFTEADILKLESKGYTWEEIEFNKLDAQVELAEENLRKNLSEACSKLQVYGVTYEQLEEIVRAKLYSKKQEL